MKGYGKELALFEGKPTDVGGLVEHYLDYKPQGQLQSDGVVHFHIPSNAQKYINLAKCKLEVKFKMSRKDGAKMQPKENCSIANIPLFTLWRQTDFYIQQQLVSTCGSNYAYKAYMDLLLDKSVYENSPLVDAYLLSKDTVGAMDSVSVGSPLSNEGFLERLLTIDGGRTRQVIGTPAIDFFKCGRLLLPGLALDLKLYPNTSEFVLMAEKNEYKLELVDALFSVCTVEVGADIAMGHIETLKFGPALYPYRRTDFKSFSVAAGLYEFTYDNVWLDKVPRNVTIAVVSSAAYSGKINKNPLSFPHFNVNFLAVYVDGSSRPGRPLAPNFAAKMYTEAFYSIADKTGIVGYTDYGSGYTMYNLKLNGTSDTEKFETVEKRAHTRVEIKFAKALPESVVVLVYAQHDACVGITSDRNVEIRT